MAGNWGGAASGALSGAATGAAFGGVGAAIGGVAGGLLGYFGGGKDPKLKNKPSGTKEQIKFGGTDLIKYLQSMMGKGGGLNAANQYDLNLLTSQPQSYEEFSSPYLQQFQEQLLPMLAEKYAGSGALSSSGFGQAIGGAGAGLQAQLAQLYSGLQLDWEQQKAQASGRIQNQFQNLTGIGLNYEPFAYHEKQGTQGFAAPLLSSLVENQQGGGLNNLLALFQTQKKTA